MELEILGRALRDFEDLDYFRQMQCFLNLQFVPEFKEKSHKKPNVRSKAIERLNPLEDFSEKEFKSYYRFAKENMRKIIEIIRDDLEADHIIAANANQVPVDHQIMAAMRTWGLTEHTEITAMVHGVTIRTLQKICKRVAAALASKASRYIRMPVTLAEKERVINAFQALAGMPNIVGCLAHYTVRLKTGTYEAVKTAETERNSYVHIQVVSDAAFKIRDLHCKPRSTNQHNYNASEVFAQTRIKERFEQNEFRGRVLLANDKMIGAPYLQTPVRCPFTAAELAYNDAHAKTIAASEMCVKLWKQRFGILNSELLGTYNTGKNTIVALALLHNMAIEWNDTLTD